MSFFTSVSDRLYEIYTKFRYPNKAVSTVPTQPFNPFPVTTITPQPVMPEFVSPTVEATGTTMVTVSEPPKTIELVEEPHADTVS